MTRMRIAGPDGKQMSVEEFVQAAPSDSKDVPGFHFTRKFKSPFIEVGDYTYGVPNIHWPSDSCKLKIGKFCSIAGGVNFYLGGHHDTDAVSTYPFHELVSDFPAVRDFLPKTSKGGITVGNDVWIAHGSLVLSGVTIGDGAVVSARSVVSRDIPPYAIVAGNYAQVVKMRFPDEVIAELLRIKWWDWPIERIREHADLIAGKDPHKLIEVARGCE